MASLFSKTKGCEIWDLDNNKFYDFSFMGVGTNILGYNNLLVDSAKKTINNGNLSTLNSSRVFWKINFNASMGSNGSLC